jgi:hypothetical protein
MLTSVVVDGRTLIGPDLLGGTWTTTALAGWHDGAGLRHERLPRSQQDGTHLSSGFRDGRAITVSGLARFSDPANAKRAADNLRAAISGGRSLMVAAGTWLDIDLRNRSVLLNGRITVRPRVTSYGDWLSVPTGGGSITWVADDADPDASLSVWSFEGAWV